jgi:hypothetical protein
VRQVHEWELGSKRWGNQGDVVEEAGRCAWLPLVGSGGHPPDLQAPHQGEAARSAVPLQHERNNEGRPLSCCHGALLQLMLVPAPQDE